MKKICKILCLVMITLTILLLCCSCSKEYVNKPQLDGVVIADYTGYKATIDNTTSIKDMEYGTYSDSYIGPSYYYGMESDIEEYSSVINEYGKHLLRCNNGTYYGISKLKDKNDRTFYVICLYEKCENFVDVNDVNLQVKESFAGDKFHSAKEFFPVILKRGTLDDIKAIDPFTVSLDGEDEENSYHYLNNGKILEIVRSKETGKVKYKYIHKDEYNLYNSLLEMDREYLS